MSLCEIDKCFHITITLTHTCDEDATAAARHHCRHFSHVLWSCCLLAITHFTAACVASVTAPNQPLHILIAYTHTLFYEVNQRISVCFLFCYSSFSSSTTCDKHFQLRYCVSSVIVNVFPYYSQVYM